MTRPPLRKPATRAKPPPRPQSGMALHTVDGSRKYLTTGERDAFLRAAEQADRQVRTLCMTLAFAGCRLSEALAAMQGARQSAAVRIAERRVQF